MKQELKKVNKKIYLIFIIAIVILVLICYVTTGKSTTVENFVYNKIAMCTTPKFTVFQKFISRIGSASFVSFYCFLLILFKIILIFFNDKIELGSYLKINLCNKYITKFYIKILNQI